MIISIHNFPSRTQYQDIKELLLSKCGISQVLLDNLTRENDGKSVMVGVATDQDATVIKQMIDGFYYEGHQLIVKSSLKETQNNAPRGGYQQNKQGGQKDSYQSNQQSGYQSNQQTVNQSNKPDVAPSGYQANQLGFQPNFGYNQGYHPGYQSNLGFNQNNLGFNPDNLGYNQGYLGFSQGNQGSNQGSKSYNQVTSGYQSNQGYSSGNAGYAQGNESYNQNFQDMVNAYPSISSVASLYDQNDKEPAHKSFPAAIGGQSQKPPSPVPSPYGQGGNYSGYPQQNDQRQQDPSSSYAGGESSGNRSTGPPVGYPEGPWGSSAQSTRNYRDDSRNDRKRGANFEGPSDRKGSRGNESSQPDRPKFARGGPSESRGLNDSPQRKWGRFDEPPDNLKGGPSTSQLAPRSRFGDPTPSEPSGRPDLPQKRSWEQANDRFEREDYGPPNSFRQNEGAGKKAKPAWNNASVFNNPARKFNKCMGEGVTLLLIEIYKMVRESTDPDVYPTNTNIRHLYQQRIQDRVYGLLEGRTDLTKHQVKILYRQNYSVNDDIDLYKDIVMQIKNVRSAEDLDRLLKTEVEINSMNAFTNRARKKALKRQLYTREELLNQLGIEAQIPTHRPPKILPQQPRAQKGKSKPPKQPKQPRVNVPNMQIPPHPNNDLKLKKQQKREAKEEMKSMTPYPMDPLLEKYVDEETKIMTDMMQEIFNNHPDDDMTNAIYSSWNGQGLFENCKKFFKLHLSKRLTNRGVILVRIHGYPDKNLKRENLEQFLLDKGCTSLKKSKSKFSNFFVATFNSYKAADKLVSMGRVTIGPPGREVKTEFKYMYLAQIQKVPYKSFIEARKRQKNSLKQKSKVDLLDKNWPEQEAAEKIKMEAKKEAAAQRRIAALQKANEQKMAKKEEQNVMQNATSNDANPDIAETDIQADLNEADNNDRNDDTKVDEAIENKNASGATNINDSAADKNVNDIASNNGATDIVNDDTASNVNDKIEDKSITIDESLDDAKTENKDSAAEKESSSDVCSVKDDKDTVAQNSTVDEGDVIIIDDGDEWDETGDGWDDTDVTVNESQNKTVDIDNIDENDLEDY